MPTQVHTALIADRTLRLTGATVEPGAILKNASRRPCVAVPRLFCSFFVAERIRSSLQAMTAELTKAAGVVSIQRSAPSHRGRGRT